MLICVRGSGVETRNITLSIPKEVLQKVKLIAVRRQTSVSELLTRTLTELVSRDDGYNAARDRQLAQIERGVDLGTDGRIAWRRDGLHER